MLTITIPLQPARELWNEKTEEFEYTEELKEQTLVLEHSLVSVSKWESRWHKPFLIKGEKTTEEVLDYVRCMTLTQNVPAEVYHRLTNENLNRIYDYINDPMTATTFSQQPNSTPSREIMTAEIIYYDMIALEIPFECQKWHLNRLLTLIRVCMLKNKPPKKMGRQELMSRNRALNAARRKKYNTRG